MKQRGAFVGLTLDVSLEDLEQVMSLVTGWEAEYRRGQQIGYGLGVNTETTVSIMLEPYTPSFALQVLMDQLEPLALPGSLCIGRGPTEPGENQGAQP